MLKFLLSIFIVLTFKLLNTKGATYYVNQNTPSASPDGSFANPYTSIAAAVTALGAITCDLYLLGTSVTITSAITISAGGNYSIAPDPSYTASSYFPIYMSTASSFKTATSNIKFTGVEFVEQLTARAATLPVIYGNPGNVTLNRILLRNVQWTVAYIFIRMAGGNQGNSLKIYNSQFENLNNTELLLVSAAVNFYNCNFTNMGQYTAPFIIIQSLTSSGAVVSMIKTRWENITIGAGANYGVMGVLSSRFSTYIHDSVFKNITCVHQYGFIQVASGTADTATEITTFSLKNIEIDGFYESTASTVSVTLATRGLFAAMTTASQMRVENISINNFFGSRFGLLSFQPSTTNFYGTQTVLPSATIKNVYIKDSTNAYFRTFFLDTLEMSNITYLRNSYSNYTAVESALLYMSIGHSATFTDIYSYDNVGPLISCSDVLWNQFTNIYVQNHTTSTSLASTVQMMIGLSRKNTAAYLQLNSSKPLGTGFQEFNVFGFKANESIDTTDIALLSFASWYGPTYINNSVWHNVHLNGFSSGATPSLSMSNMTFSDDHSETTTSVNSHRLIDLTNIAQGDFTDLTIINNKRIAIFRHNNMRRSDVYDNTDLTIFNFKNIQIINNTGDYYTSSTRLYSFFIFYNPTKSSQITFKNVTFEDNLIFSSLIYALESYNVDLSIVNCTFHNNTATQSGVVLTSSNMKSTQSNLVFTDNIITNNYCTGNGAVFYFVVASFKTRSSNNVYKYNQAGGSGGVGYFFSSDANFVETGSTYLSNSAVDLGGNWFINIKAIGTNTLAMSFSDTTFENSYSNEKGGAFYLEAGMLTLDDCSFKNSRATTAGGDIYVVSADSVSITDTTFTESSSADGIVLAGEDATDAIFTIKDIQVHNIAFNNTNARVLFMNYGTMTIEDSTFSDIEASLFSFVNVEVTLTDLTISDITCTIGTTSSCLVASSASTVTFSDSTITDITSNTDIMDFKSTTTVALSELTVSNLKNTITKATQLFFIGAYKVTAFSLADSKLTQSEFSGINSTSSVISVSDTTFSNKAERRLLASRTLATASTEALLQFIYLISSSSVITNAKFIENNPTSTASTIKGGAIRILGTGGTHVISGSLFEGNQANTGGAISIEGSISSFSIDDTEFTSNSATTYGGAIVIANQSIATTPTIKDSYFETNKAEFGGAMYVGNQKLTISKTLFLANSATSEGGAIGSIAKSTNTMTISNSNFTQNTAVQGAALMAFGDMVFTYPSTTFLQNVAEYGSDVSSKPTQLRLRVHEVSPLYLLSEETNIPQMLKYSTTVLIYDSISSDLRDTLYQPTGLSPNYLFEFSFINSFDETIQNLSDMEITVTLLDADSEENTSKLGLIGTPSLTIIDSVTYMFNSFAVRGVIGSTFNTSAKGTYLNIATGLTETLSALVWNMTVSSCSVGEIYDSSANTCTKCDSGAYSFTDPKRAKVCNSCLDNAVCLGAEALYPSPGYWRIDKYSENIIECPNADACLGGQLDPDNIANISYTGACDPKYEGVACSSCSDGRAKFGSNSSCIDCKNSAMYYLMFVGYFIIELGMVVFTVKSSLSEGKAKNAHKSKKEALQSALSKILIDFIQIITLTSEFSFRWPFNMGTALKVFSKFVPTNTDSLSVDCFIALGKGNNKEIFFNKVLILGAEPFLCVFVSWLIWVYIFRKRGQPVRNNKELKTKLIMTTVIIMYVLQPGVVKVMFQLFNCQNFGSESNPEYYLVDDTNIKCLSAQHLRWSLGIGVPSLFLGLVVPIALLAYAAKSKKLQASEDFKLRYSFMFKIYKDGFFGWELVIMSRKVLIIIISVFISSTYLQAYLCTIILLAQFQMEFRVNPYFDKNLNTFEGLSLFASTFIMYSGLYFVRSYSSTGSIFVAYVLLVCDLIVGSWVILYAFYVARRVFRQQTTDMKNRLQKFIEKASTTGKSSFLTQKLAKASHSLLVALTPRNSSEGSDNSSNSDSSREYKGSDNPFANNTHNLQIVSSDDLLSPKNSQLPLVDGENILNFESPMGKSANLSRFGREFSPRGSPQKNLSPGKNLSHFFPNPEFSISKASSLVFEPGSPKIKKDESLAEENVDADETSMRMDIPSPYLGLKERPKPLQSISHHVLKNYDQESWSPMCDESEQASVRKLISPRDSFMASPVGTPRNFKLLSNRDSSWNGDLSIDSTRIMKKLIAFSPHDSMIQLPSIRKSPRENSYERRSNGENSVLRRSERDNSASRRSERENSGSRKSPREDSTS